MYFIFKLFIGVFRLKKIKKEMKRAGSLNYPNSTLNSRLTLAIHLSLWSQLKALYRGILLGSWDCPGFFPGKIWQKSNQLLFQKCPLFLRKLEGSPKNIWQWPAIGLPHSLQHSSQNEFLPGSWVGSLSLNLPNIIPNILRYLQVWFPLPFLFDLDWRIIYGVL